MYSCKSANMWARRVYAPTVSGDANT